MSYAENKARFGYSVDRKLEENRTELSKMKQLLKHYGTHGISAVLEVHAREQINTQLREAIYQMSRDLREALEEEVKK